MYMYIYICIYIYVCVYVYIYIYIIVINNISYLNVIYLVSSRGICSAAVEKLRSRYAAFVEKTSIPVIHQIVDFRCVKDTLYYAR